MPLVPLLPVQVVRERHHWYGFTGAGKSNSVWSIAELLHQTGSPGRVKILDTDDGAFRTFYSRFQHLSNVDIYPAPTWADLQAQMKVAVQSSDFTRGDWIVLDVACKVWAWAADYFVQKVYGMDIEDFLLEARMRTQQAKGKSGAPPIDGFKDWPVIKKMFYDVINTILGARCHTIFCTYAAPVDGTLDDQKTLNVCANIGFKPQGEKNLIHAIDTATYFYQKRGGINPVYALKTGKDRDRLLQDVEVPAIHGTDQAGNQAYFGGWAYQYLIGVAGWKIQ